MVEQILEFENGAIKSYDLSGMEGRVTQAILNAACTHYFCDNWQVEIKNHRGKLSIVVDQFNPATHKKIRHHQFGLRDGVLQIHYEDRRSDDYAKFHTGRANDLLEPFGITDVVIGDPNFRKAYGWNPQGQATGKIVLNWLVTDGRHNVVGFGEADEDTAERLKWACGEITHVVEDATWTVVCSYEKKDTEIESQITLYTENPNLFLISKKLEDYLKSSEKYARFEDIVEDFLVE